MSRLLTPVASFKTTITQKVTSTADTIPIDLVVDDAGNSLDGKRLAFVIDKGTATEETVLGTVDADEGELTTVTRGLDPQDGQTSRAALKFAHRKKATIEITAHPYLILVARALNGEDGIDPSYRPKLSSDVDASGNEFVSKAELTRAVMGGLTVSSAILPATAGETILSTDRVVYLKEADGRWWKASAAAAATCENVILGLSLGAGTAGNAITGGVLLLGWATHITGLTANTKYYLSDTAGAIATTPGTKEVTLGKSRGTAEFLFARGYDQLVTEDELDALAGSAGTPSGTNKFVTQLENRLPIYAASATGNDTYVITPSPAIAAYADGQMFHVKPDTGNTTTASLNVNGLGAINILHQDGTALGTGDIVANKPFIISYIGGVFYLLSTPALLTAGITTPLVTLHAHKTGSLTASRVLTDATAAVTYAHGLAAIPNWVRVSVNAGSFHSTGFYERAANVQNYVYSGNTVGSGAGSICILTDANGSQTGVVTAIDATNITITWTKGGASGASAAFLMEFGI